MSQLFTVKWPWLARLEAVALFPALIVLIADGAAAGVQRYLGGFRPIPVLERLLGLGGTGLFAIVLGAIAVIVFMGLLVVIDRLMSIRKGSAMLACLAVIFWSSAAAELSDHLGRHPRHGPIVGVTFALLAGGIAAAVHWRPFWDGMAESGFGGGGFVPRRAGWYVSGIVLSAPRGRPDWFANRQPGTEAPPSGQTAAGASLMVVLVACLAAAAAYRLASGEGPPMPETAPAPTLPAEARPAVPDTTAGHAAGRRTGVLFVVDAEVNGAHVPMILDTAAAFVFLRAEDARRAGFAPSALVYSRRAEANGVSLFAPVRIATLAVGGIVRHGVDALVAPPGRLPAALLGQSFLTLLDGFEVRADRLFLHGRSDTGP